MSIVALLWQWRKAIALGAVAICLSLIAWRVVAWHSAFEALPGVQAALEAERACSDGSECQVRLAAAVARQEAISQEVQSNYERELESLRSRPPAPPVRLCRPARPSDVRRPEPAGPADGAAPGGDVPLEASDDIGQRLFALADACDAEALRLRYLQDWNRAISQPPAP